MSCFSVLCAACALLVQTVGPEDAGVFEGRVTYTGAVPRRAIADYEGRYRPLLAVNKQNRGLRYCVVSLHRRNGHAPTSEPPRPDLEPAPVVDQVDYRFQPEVIAIQAGARVAFGNGDSANHNVRAQAVNPQNGLNILTQSSRVHEKVFRTEPGGRPIRLSCDIHAWMAGWIYVFEHPHFAVTDDSGAFRIEGVPAGLYEVRIHQPSGDLHATGTVTIAGGQSHHAAIAFTAEHLQGRSKAPVSTSVAALPQP